MSVQEIEKRFWKIFFDSFTQALAGKQAEVEVASLEIGDQIEAKWAPLIGLSYDPKADVFEAALEGVDHLVQSPREIYVDYDIGGLIALEVVDGEGTRQIIKLKDPLALPAPDQIASREFTQ